MEKVNWRCEFMEDIVDEIEKTKFTLFISL